MLTDQYTVTAARNVLLSSVSQPCGRVRLSIKDLLGPVASLLFCKVTRVRKRGSAKTALPRDLPRTGGQAQREIG